MHLIIDRGNTRTKIALFGEGEDYDVMIIEELTAGKLCAVLDNLGDKVVTHGIFASVVQDNDEVINCLEARMGLIRLTESCPLPVKNLYSSPETLGHDRIAAAVAASGIFPGSDVLSIDAGTCITYDFINSGKEYLGGGIAPGLSMRFKALHTFTSKLPLVSLDSGVGLIGDSTANSIRSGVFNGIVAEIDGITDRYFAEYPGLKIILTGGDANYFDKKLKNDIFAVPNLVLLGLKDILLYNVEK